jgi:NAD-dependent dihydropyrimidine dehydrogenase PreA subunit
MSETPRTSKRFPGVEWVGDDAEFIRVNEAKCTGCADCLRVCLAECFEVVHKKARVRSLAECM